MPSRLADLGAQVAATHWYHTIDLPGGVTTPGYFDVRGVAAKVLPEDLSGMRCLDAATSSGFWAFEMERRGAESVVAIDIDTYDAKDWQLPWMAPSAQETQQRAFEIARDALDSRVERRICNLYDASPDQLGRFDFVFIGSVLLHLRDPVRALRALRTVTQGELRSFEPRLMVASLLHPRACIGRLATVDDSRWWTPNAAAHRRWMVAAGLEIVAGRSPLFQPFGAGFFGRPPLREFRHPAKAAFWLVRRPIGVPSGWYAARPAAIADVALAGD